MDACLSDGNSRGQLSVRYETSRIVIEFLRVITQEGDYHVAMENALEVLSKVVLADRVYIMEQQRRLDSRFFERCSEGVPPRIAAIKQVSDDKLAAFVSIFKGCGIIYAETLEQLGIRDPRIIAYFQKAGVESMLVVPLRENGRFVGCLAADNFKLAGNIEAEWLLETIAPFLATVISNYQLLEELEWSVTHDPLTALMNRRGVDDALNEYLAGSEASPFSLALIDVDDFKGINDTYGHAAGDDALVTLAKAMFEEFPCGALLGRHGGDELLAILTGEAADEADEVISRFSNREISIDCEGVDVLLTTSIGYTSYPGQASSVKEAYNQADAALYAVKQSGKAGARRYSPELAAQQSASC